MKKTGRTKDITVIARYFCSVVYSSIASLCCCPSAGADVAVSPVAFLPGAVYRLHLMRSLSLSLYFSPGILSHGSARMRGVSSSWVGCHALFNIAVCINFRRLIIQRYATTCIA